MVDKNAVRRGYDGVAETYAAERSDEGRDIDILDQFLQSLSESSRILDVGCGQGAPVLRRLNVSAIATGVDFSRKQLGLASENVPGVPLIQGDMTRLPICDNAFEAITAYHSLIHVPLNEHQTVIDEFARILHPQGRLLLSEAPDEWSGTNPDWLESGVEMQWNIAGAEPTRKHLRNGGFTITNEWETSPGDNEHWVFFSAELDR